MKDPTHPAGPAFDKARDEEAALRARRIAALTPEQRREYDQRSQEEQRKIEAERDRLAETRKERIDKDAERRAGELRPSPIGIRAMQRRQAERQAAVYIQGQDKAALERADIAARDRLDGYLQRAEQDRQQQSRGSVERGPQPREEFKDRARDPSLGRAFARAKERQGREQDRTHEMAPERSRDTGSGKDESLKRAFEQARQRQSVRNQEMGRER